MDRFGMDHVQSDARRIDTVVALAELGYADRALGRAPDPRPNYAPPVYFQGRLVLPAEVAGRRERIRVVTSVFWM